MPGLLIAGISLNPFVILKDPWWFALALALSALVFAGVMFALHQLSPIAKKWLTIACTFLAGLYFLLEFFVPRYANPKTGEIENFITPTLTPVNEFVAVTLQWTIGLGIISLCMVHGKRLFSRGNGWHHSLTFFVALFGMLFFGFWTQAGNPDPHTVIGGVSTVLLTLQIVRWLLVLVGAGYLVALVMALLKPREDAVAQRRAVWQAALPLAFAAVGIAVTLWASAVIGPQWKGSVNPNWQQASANASAVYNTLFRGVMVNLEGSMFALLAFYIASAAYRAFRVRSAEAAVLMIAAFIVMLGFVHFGALITAGIPANSPFAILRLENLSGFTLGWLNMPAYRAVILGVEVGALAMAMRIWLSLERGAFFSQESK
jgi:hypothetical protein